MMSMQKENEELQMRDFDRAMFRAAISSVFWAVIADRKSKPSGFKFQWLADRLGIHKSAVSRWFTRTPNWTIDTVSDIASALDIQIRIEARDRKTGRIYRPDGPVVPATVTTIPGGKQDAADEPKTNDGVTNNAECNTPFRLVAA